MALNLKQLKKISNNPWSFVLSDEHNPYGVETFFDTGCYALNAFLSDGDIYKGCILGKKYAYSGESSTAKSYFIAYMIKAFLDTYEDATVLFYETEGSSIRQMAEAIGIDMTRVIVEPVSIIEELKTNALQYIEKLEADYIATKERTRLMVVLDSLGMLSTNKELDDGKAGKDTKDMTMAAAKKAFYRAISLKFSLLQIPMITANHSYTNIGGYGDSQVEGGGSGFQYAGDVRFLLSKSQKRAGNLQTGVSIRVKIKKSRFIKENQTINIDLDFEKGLNKYSHMVEFANACGMLKADDDVVTFEGKEYVRQMFEEKFGDFFVKEKMDILRERIKVSLGFGENDNVETMSVDKLVAHGVSMGLITDTPRTIILPDGTKIKKNELRANEDLIPSELISQIKENLLKEKEAD
jgi:hypothetical protein